jgi:hypothetical protein
LASLGRIQAHELTALEPDQWDLHFTNNASHQRHVNFVEETKNEEFRKIKVGVQTPDARKGPVPGPAPPNKK